MPDIMCKQMMPAAQMFAPIAHSLLMRACQSQQRRCVPDGAFSPH